MRPLLTLMIAGLATLSFVTQSVGASLIDRYYAALQMDEVFEILRDEGIAAGQDMTRDGQISPSAAWTARLDQIYAIDKMDAIFRHALKTTAEFELSEDAIAFFETELGARIVRLELDARLALAEDGMEDEMLNRVKNMREQDAGRVALYQEFIDANDLVESNVTGALNANLAFYRGMASNPVFADGLSEETMLTMVWAQEADIRQSTKNWTIGFSALAYGILGEAELQDYIDISVTSSGQKLNAALFSGFDKIFEVQSFELGRATAEFSAGDET